MRIPQRPRARAISFNMTPMIDVVFQLIIFFLVSSHLAKQETQLKLPLPAADSADAEADAQRPSLVVNVLADGQWLLAGRVITPEQFPTRVQEAVAEHGSELEVKIRADRAVAYRHVEPIMLACYRGGIHDVTYSVYRSQDVTD
jgi:biopolymer transport protein ExbD